jgi:hypothetical protein
LFLLKITDKNQSSQKRTYITNKRHVTNPRADTHADLAVTAAALAVTAFGEGCAPLPVGADGVNTTTTDTSFQLAWMSVRDARTHRTLDGENPREGADGALATFGVNGARCDAATGLPAGMLSAPQAGRTDQPPRRPPCRLPRRPPLRRAAAAPLPCRCATSAPTATQSGAPVPNPAGPRRRRLRARRPGVVRAGAASPPSLRGRPRRVVSLGPATGRPRARSAGPYLSAPTMYGRGRGRRSAQAAVRAAVDVLVALTMAAVAGTGAGLWRPRHRSLRPGRAKALPPRRWAGRGHGRAAAPSPPTGRQDGRGSGRRPPRRSLRPGWAKAPLSTS